MKKKLAMVLLALGLVGLAAGCGKSKEENKESEEPKKEVDLTNDKGLVVALDLENIEEYVKLGEYKNLEISVAPKEEATDELVEKNIHYLLLKNYKPVEVKEDRAVQQDDTLVVDYTGYKDGEAFEGGAAKDAEICIGAGGFIPGFEEGLIGHKKGEEVTLDLTFPEDYRAKELAGKAVQFKVKIHKISAPPELTDAWVKENTEFKTVKEFKESKKKEIQASLNRDYEGSLRAKLFGMVVENSEIVKFPDEFMEDTKAMAREQLNAMYQMQTGISFDEYAKSQNLSEEEINKGLEESAKQYLTQSLIVQAIMDAESMEFTEKEYEKEKEKYAISSGFPDVETMEQYAGEEQIRDNVLWNAVSEKIQSTAKVKEEKK